MSPDPDTLPRFRNPPVGEVAVGVQFTLPGFLPTHYGRFHERIRDEFPGVQVLPPVPQQVESFVAPTGLNQPAILPPFFGFAMPLLPRVLFISGDGSSLIQLQSDRLYFNWRKPALGEYPHYDRFRDKFSKAYSAFAAFVADEGMGAVAPSQCDVFYVNPLPQGVTGVAPSSPERVFRCWNVSIGEEWPTALEDLSFNSRYKLVDEAGQPFGRLIVTMSTVVGSDGIEQLRLELTARGAPRGPGLAGVLAFHDVGHDAIVRCFSAITTPEMHERWGRYEHE
jgi:uncharacterized protein (TIGR04255 family)